MVRALASHARGRGSESLCLHQKKAHPYRGVFFFYLFGRTIALEGEKNLIVTGEFFISTAKNVDERKRFRYNNKCYGVIAQLVARLNGIQKVRGSTPLSSTTEKGRLIAVLFFVRIRDGRSPAFSGVRATSVRTVCRKILQAVGARKLCCLQQCYPLAPPRKKDG